MPHEELSRSGDWLFRRRSWLPLPVVALAAACAYVFADRAAASGAWLAVCAAVTGLGFAVRVLTIAHTPRGTSGRNTREQVAEELNTTGAYSVVRHPLYVGNLLMWIGAVSLPGLWWLTAVGVVVFWQIYRRIAAAEDAFLTGRFGDDYRAWAESTPAWLPDPARYRPPALPFSLRAVVAREYNGAYAAVVVFCVIEGARRWGLDGRPDLPAGWLWTLSAASAIWLLARSLKRWTAWLRVPGR